MYLYANEGVKRIAVRDEQGEDPVSVEFDDNGKARVDRETGEYLKERVPNLTIEQEHYDTSDDEEE